MSHFHIMAMHRRCECGIFSQWLNRWQYRGKVWCLSMTALLFHVVLESPLGSDGHYCLLHKRPQWNSSGISPIALLR